MAPTLPAFTLSLVEKTYHLRAVKHGKGREIVFTGMFLKSCKVTFQPVKPEPPFNPFIKMSLSIWILRAAK